MLAIASNTTLKEIKEIVDCLLSHGATTERVVDAISHYQNTPERIQKIFIVIQYIEEVRPQYPHLADSQLVS